MKIGFFLLLTLTKIYLLENPSVPNERDFSTTGKQSNTEMEIPVNIYKESENVKNSLFRDRNSPLRKSNSFEGVPPPKFQNKLETYMITKRKFYSQNRRLQCELLNITVRFLITWTICQWIVIR